MDYDTQQPQIIDLTSKEVFRLNEFAKRKIKRFLLFPFIYIIPIIVYIFFPVSWLPRSFSKSAYYGGEMEASLIELIGWKFTIIIFLVYSLFFWMATFADYRYFRLKKDLREKKKIRVRLEVKIADIYKGTAFVRFKRNKFVNVVHFSESNYVRLRKGDVVDVEVYPHSKFLVGIVGRG